MAIIDEDIVVKFRSDGELVFKHPGKRLLVVMQEFQKGSDGKDLDEDAQALKFWEQLVSVKNLSKKDGSPVTVEDIKAGLTSDMFFQQVFRGWMSACVKIVQGESQSSDPKNA